MYKKTSLYLLKMESFLYTQNMETYFRSLICHIFKIYSKTHKKHKIFIVVYVMVKIIMIIYKLRQEIQSEILIIDGWREQKTVTIS